MSQQHAQFEEEFRDGPPPSVSYESGYTGPQPVSYTTSAPPPVQSYVLAPGQKLLVQEPHERPNSTGARLALAIVSLIFLFITYMIALAVTIAERHEPSTATSLSIFFALIFSVVTIIINIIFNRKH